MWFQHTRLGRMNGRYGAVRGAQLAGGIAYAGLFSVFAGLTIAVTVFMQVLGGRKRLQDAVFNNIAEALPGILKTDDDPNGLVSPDSLVLDQGLSITGAVATAVLLLSAIGVMSSLSGSIRAVFGLAKPPRNAVLAKVTDLLGFVFLAVSVVATAALGIIAGTAGSWVVDTLALPSGWGQVLVRGLGLVSAFGVDMVVFAYLIRYLAGARPPRRDLWWGAAIGAFGTGVLRIAGTSLVGSADNAILAASAAIVTLLLWVNLAARLMLYIAAWTANPPVRFEDVVTPEELHLRERPNYVTLSAPHTLDWDHDAYTGKVQPHEAERRERELAARVEELEREQLERAVRAAGRSGGPLHRLYVRHRMRVAAHRVRQEAVQEGLRDAVERQFADRRPSDAPAAEAE
ncbi:YihY/virulence factor BrkB family protein [Serinibacter salmoneus]|uniref:YihY/virulence factor BrkB family protein n=1 Tax=Serinibacter salmoneus TaxID=556530 RepID=UPI001FE54643|nr:YihY/virulence factor BrkB family protein [Serinibacter salmoneus]